LATKAVKAKKRSSNSAKSNDQELREQLITLLKGGGAHVSFSDAVAGFPEGKRGTFATGLPHTGWELIEHLRIAQWDILEYSRNPKHVSPDFPEGYWPRVPAPSNSADWDKTVDAVERDTKEMIELLNDSRNDLFAKLSPTNEQTLLREALVLADHNSYHIAQIVDLRRALGSWTEG
jgi:DinB superfamily